MVLFSGEEQQKWWALCLRSSEFGPTCFKKHSSWYHSSESCYNFSFVARVEIYKLASNIWFIRYLLSSLSCIPRWTWNHWICIVWIQSCYKHDRAIRSSRGLISKSRPSSWWGTLWFLQQVAAWLFGEIPILTKLESFLCLILF